MKHWITYHQWPQSSPVGSPVFPAVSKWTGRSTGALGDAETQLLAEALDPTSQRPVPGEGYPSFHVLADGFEWRFASLREIDLVIDTLSQKHLPNVRSLAWWANRLPGGMMSLAAPTEDHTSPPVGAQRL